MLTVFLGLTWSSLQKKSVTFDEFAHLPAGLSYLRTGDFRLEAFNSPLIRLLAALPLVNDETVNLPLERGWQIRNHWNFGYEFMSANAESYHRIFLRARAVILGLGALCIAVAWLWTRRLWGRLSALAAAALLAFDPNFMAHSRLVTGDVGAALTTLLAVIACWAFLTRLTWPRALAAGLALGAALLSKFSSLALLAVPPVLALATLPDQKKINRAGLVLQLLVVYLFAWITICSFFKWEGVGRPLETYTFKSRAFINLSSRMPYGLPFPLPARLVEGMDATSLFNEKAVQNYLMGKTYAGGRPDYFLAAFLLKTPLSTIVLIGIGLASLFCGRLKKRREKWLLLVPPLIIIAFVSLASHYNIGVRYLLPAFPFLFIIAAAPLAEAQKPRLAVKIVIFALVASSAIASFRVHPHYLAYFNLAAGGPERGHLLLADSNLDWGQDLIGLKDYMDERGLDSICLVYFGRVDPVVYGIEHEVTEHPEQCEVFAVSTQFLLGFTSAIVSRGVTYEYPEGRFRHLLAREPTAIINHTIRVFDNRKD